MTKLPEQPWFRVTRQAKWGVASYDTRADGMWTGVDLAYYPNFLIYVYPLHRYVSTYWYDIFAVGDTPRPWSLGPWLPRLTPGRIY